MFTPLSYLLSLNIPVTDLRAEMLTETAIFKGMLRNIYGKQILNTDVVTKCSLIGAKIIPGDSSPLSVSNPAQCPKLQTPLTKGVSVHHRDQKLGPDTNKT